MQKKLIRRIVCLNNRQIKVSEMHFDNFPNPLTIQWWKTTFKTEVCSCSGFTSEAMLWSKEVELVEPLDDRKTSQLIIGTESRILSCLMRRLRLF